MSSSAGSKFQDHYAVLGIEPKADLEIIQHAFAELKAKYDPKNGATPDADKLEAVHIAYEVLSDTSLRKAFDRAKGVNQNEGDPKFSGPSFFEAVPRDTLLRLAVLCILYDRRRTHPYTPTLSMRALENIIAAGTEELIVALWYLKQRILVINDDKSSLQITVDGLDFLDQQRPSADLVMPFIKPTGIEGAPPPAEMAHAEPVHVDSVPVEPMPVEVVHADTSSAPPPAAKDPVSRQFKSHESVLSVLNRALSRS